MSDTADKPKGQIAVDRLQWGSLNDWIQLVRLPTAFTLLSNCLAAAIVAGTLWWPLTALLPAIFASLLAYWAGMILNDVVDLEEDRIHRPDRPLVREKISPVLAGHVARAFLLLGPFIVLTVVTLHPVEQIWRLAAFMSSAILSCCVYFYNSPMKLTPLGPVLMGACRGMNILAIGCTLLAVQVAAPTGSDTETQLSSAEATLSAEPAAGDEQTLPSTAPAEIESPVAAGEALTSDTVQLPSALIGYAAAIAIYIIGVTTYARHEEKESSPTILSFGLTLQVGGLVLLGALPIMLKDSESFRTLDPTRGYPLLIGLISMTIINRSMAGIRHPVSRKVQLGVKHSLLSLILLDAAVVLMWSGPWYSGVLIALLLLALFSSIKVRST
ncbi:MAG TPA: hypothetical protein DDW52_11900 [Planctomycetaceae bacterium]|nr:hypothetical protein [Planctomycetaceae bacterium]